MNGQINQGEVISVRGSVIDARFEKSLPRIYNVLKTGEVTIEVLIHINPETVRGIALTPTQGLARGSAIVDTGQPLMVPVGEKLLGRLFNVFGAPIDNKGKIEPKDFRSIHPKQVPLSQHTTNLEEHLNELHIKFNRQRQAGITSDLLDILTGFEAQTSSCMA